MGTLRTLAILVFTAVVLYGGIFALVWREELFGSAIPGILLILLGLSTFIAFLRVRYRAAKAADSTVEYRS
jgi:F0F1-type ATP synthase assembly protein I